MEIPVLSHLLLPLLLLSVAQTHTFALKKPYVVYLGSHTHGFNPTAADIDSVTNSHFNLLGSYLGSIERAQESIFYSYTRHINGFAALLDEEQAERIRENPNVVSVFLSKGKKLHTTRSWEFLGLEGEGVNPLNSVWNKARYGEDTIIGNLDTGVWPESVSFSDEGLGPIPSRWRGVCQHGSTKSFRCNRDSAESTVGKSEFIIYCGFSAMICHNGTPLSYLGKVEPDKVRLIIDRHGLTSVSKLIGARFFNKGYNAYAGNASTFHSARDMEGHGSHTLSTAGGSFVKGANVFSNGNGTAKGGSPRARVASYKVCGPAIDGQECFDADILAGFEAAISDGVDVLSVSLGGNAAEFFEDGIAIGSFHAVKNGVTVIASAGNAGPSPQTVSNVAPWLFTVGASTIDREFETYVSLGPKKHFKGTSLSDKSLPKEKFYPLISSVDAKLQAVEELDAQLCMNGTIDPKKVKGKILLCLRGESARVEKGQEAASAGAVGMILANDEANGNDITADVHVLPASHVTYSAGQMIYAYVNSTKYPMAYITRAKTVAGTKPAPFMAAFSSRGPNSIEEEILKPDITAPGVNIIAAYSEAVGPTGEPFDERRIPFNTESGTSMSCPHVAGVVGLLKTMYPDWSPAAIKSAIMTTARTRDNNQEPILDSSFVKATPFAYGAGHIRPNRAMDPGLVYDLSVDDYLDIFCAEGYSNDQIRLFTNGTHKCKPNFQLVNLNYPSITVPNLQSNITTVTRRVKNVGPPATYTSRVKALPGVSVSIRPRILKFAKTGEEKQFKVILKAKADGKPSDYVFGHLVWSDGKHYVRSPLTVKHS